MVSKENLLLLGLIAMVVLISFEVRARDLAKASSISAMARIIKEKKVASDVEYEKNICTEDLDHPDCFFGGGSMPGMPGGGGMPGMLGGGGMHGGGGMPGMSGGGGGMPQGGDKFGMPGGGNMLGMPAGGDMPGAPRSGGPSAQP